MSSNFFKELRKIPGPVFLVLIFSVIFIFALWALLFRTILADIETITYDWRAKIATESNMTGISFSNHDPDIVLLAANDDTTKILENYPEVNPGRWPWQRDIWGDVVNFIYKGNPKSIVFDLKFEGTQGVSDADIQSDKYFADSIKGKNVVIATALSHPRKSEKVVKILDMLNDELNKQGTSIENVSNEAVDKYLSRLYALVFKRSTLREKFALEPDENYYKNLAYGNTSDRKLLDHITFYEQTSLYEKLLKNAEYLGVINLQQSDNVVFRNHVPVYRLVHADGISFLPSLPLAGVLSAIPDKDKTPIKLEEDKLIIGPRHIPLNKEGSLLLNWHGPGETYENIPAARVILSAAYEKGEIKTLKESDRVRPEYFKNKIVVIGQTSAGTDIHPTPMSSVYPGPEIIVTAIDNLLNDADITNPTRRKFIQETSFLTNLLVTIFLCFIIGYAMINSKSNIYKVGTFVLTIIFFILTAVFLFVHPDLRIWLNMTYPLIFMVLTGISSYAYVTYQENKERKQVELMFGKFVSPQILDKLLTEKKEISQEGQRKVMTVLFSDIRGFTEMSEQIPADEVIAILNEYITEMVEIILSYNGTLDKYIGDAIMAFYNDPVEMEDHALRAVLTAMGMKKRLNELNKNWESLGKSCLNIGIGINTGEMIVGHMGSHRLVDYTVIGDNVNLSSRIESLTKQYGVNILISESTHEQVKNKIETRYIDEVTVKGKKNSVKIYEVIDLLPEYKDLATSMTVKLS